MMLSRVLPGGQDQTALYPFALRAFTIHFALTFQRRQLARAASGAQMEGIGKHHRCLTVIFTNSSTAPDVCTCAEGWSGYNCRTPLCEVIADPLTRTQLNTVYEDKIVSFESDPCGVTAIYGYVLWDGIDHTLGNCTLPNECTCLCTMRYDTSLCNPSKSVDHCRGPWQDDLIQVRNVLANHGPEYIFGMRDCEQGFEGNYDEFQRFTTCHQIIYKPPYVERFSVQIIVGTVLGAIVGSILFYFIRRRWKRRLLLEKIERRKQQRGDDEEEEMLLQANA